MFKKLIASYQLPDGSYVVLRVNDRDEFVTHRVYSRAIVESATANRGADPITVLLRAEGDSGNYFTGGKMENLVRATDNFHERITNLLSVMRL
jgi:hypothetical protein